MRKMPAPPMLPAIDCPLRIDDYGQVRIGKTRVTLQTLVFAHRQGDRPEQIQVDYDAITLPDVYAALGYYLKHADLFDPYLKALEEYDKELRREIEARQGPGLSRAELLARRAAKLVT